MMLDPSVIDVVRRWIEEDNVFYDRFHKDIWKTISRLKDKNESIDMISVLHNFPKKDYKDREIAYEISGIATSEATTSNAESYARMVHEHYLRRKMVEHSHRLIKNAEDNAGS